MSVCLSTPTQDCERNRLAYVLYLLRMSQKLKNINVYLPHERERTSGSREKQTFHIFWALLKLPFKIGDLFTTTIITIAQVNCNQAMYWLMHLFASYSSEMNKYLLLSERFVYGAEKPWLFSVLSRFCRMKPRLPIQGTVRG